MRQCIDNEVNSHTHYRDVIWDFYTWHRLYSQLLCWRNCIPTVWPCSLHVMWLFCFVFSYRIQWHLTGEIWSNFMTLVNGVGVILFKFQKFQNAIFRGTWKVIRVLPYSGSARSKCHSPALVTWLTYVRENKSWTEGPNLHSIKMQFKKNKNKRQAKTSTNCKGGESYSLNMSLYSTQRVS